MASVTPPSSSDNFSHSLKAIGFGCKMVGSTVALIVAASAIAAIAVALLAWNGFFVYSLALKAPLNLIWAVPLTLGLVGIDLFIILSIIKKSETPGRCLLQNIRESGIQMVEHLKTLDICCNQS